MVYLHYPIWSIWTQLGFLYKVFWLVLSLVSASMLIFTVGIWARLRSRMAQREGKNVSSSRRSLADLDDRLKNVRQLVGAALYFFGLLSLIQLTQDAWVTEPGQLSFGITIRGIL
jgi:hypothetical protein